MNKSFEKGAAVLEAAFLVPFLLFTSLACWDSAKILNAHAVLLQNADDLAQWSSSDPDLTTGAYQVRFTGALQPVQPLPPALPVPLNTNLCPNALGYECQVCSGTSCGGSCGGASANILNLCTAIAAMESTGLPEIRESTVVARMNFNTPASRPDRIEITLSATFDGLFLFKNKTMQVKKLLPYLGPRG
jgi:hypothetical protein